MTDRSKTAEGQKTGSASRNDYEQELGSAQLQVERERNKDVERELREGDKEADAMNESRERQDPDYDPGNPREEQIEREYREGGEREI